MIVRQSMTKHGLGHVCREAPASTMFLQVSAASPHMPHTRTLASAPRTASVSPFSGRGAGARRSSLLQPRCKLRLLGMHAHADSARLRALHVADLWDGVYRYAWWHVEPVCTCRLRTYRRHGQERRTGRQGLGRGTHLSCAAGRPGPTGESAGHTAGGSLRLRRCLLRRRVLLSPEPFLRVATNSFVRLR